MMKTMTSWLATDNTDRRSTQQLTKKNRGRNRPHTQMTKMTRKIVRKKNSTCQPSCRKRWQHNCETPQYQQVAELGKHQCVMELIQWSRKEQLGMTTRSCS